MRVLSLLLPFLITTNIWSQTSGTSVYKRVDFNLESGNTFDLLRLIPQLEVSTDATISISGNGAAMIMINNRPAASGGDYRPILEQIQVEGIKDIEVIAGSSARYDAEASGGVVNINLIGDGMEGASGTMETKIQTGEKSDLNGGIMVKKGKWGSQLNANARQYKTQVNQFIKTENYKNVDTVFTEQVIVNTPLSHRLGADLSVDYSPNTYHIIELSAGAAIATVKVDSDIENISSEADNSYSYKNMRVVDRHNNRMSLNYNGILSGDSEYKKVLNTTASYFYSGSEDVRNSRLVYTDYTKTDFVFINLQADYEQELQNNSAIEAGVRTYARSSDMDYLRDSTGDDDIRISLTTDRFHFTEDVHAMYLQWSGETNLLNINLGLRGEYANLNANQQFEINEFNKRYFHFFPTASLTHHFNENHNLGLNYNKSIRRPRMHEINPFVNDMNPNNIQFGNPDLEPSLTHTYELKYSGYKQSGLPEGYTKKHRWYALFSYRERENRIYRATLPSAIEGVTETSYYNLNRHFDYTLELMYSSEFLKEVRVDLIPSYRYMFQDGSNIDNSIKNETGYYQLRLNANICLWRNAQLLINSFYRSAYLTPQGSQEAYSRADFSFRQSFLDNKLTVTLKANNPFGNNKIETIVTHDEFEQERITVFESTVYEFGVRFNFGKMNIKNKEINPVQIFNLD